MSRGQSCFSSYPLHHSTLCDSFFSRCLKFLCCKCICRSPVCQETPLDSIGYRAGQMKQTTYNGPYAHSLDTPGSLCISGSQGELSLPLHVRLWFPEEAMQTPQDPSQSCQETGTPYLKYAPDSPGLTVGCSTVNSIAPVC